MDQLKHKNLKNYIGKILEKNISYIFILPLFDKLNIYVKSKLGNKLAISLYQYLAAWGVTNSYLQYKNHENILWLKLNKTPKNSINTFIADIDPMNYLELFHSLISLQYVFLEEYVDHTLIGLPIPSRFYNDIELIKQGRYSEVSKEYKEALTFRTRSVYNDGSLEAMIVQHAIAFNICNRSSDLKHFLEVYFGMPINDKQMWQKINNDHEILCTENQSEFNKIN